MLTKLGTIRDGDSLQHFVTFIFAIVLFLILLGNPSDTENYFCKVDTEKQVS